jgi:hypothetical protein
MKHFILDDKMITSLCDVATENSVAFREEILVTITRDNFLLGESDTIGRENSGENISSNPLQIFSLTDAVWDYMIHTDHDQRPIFANFDANSRRRFFTYTDSLSSCGSGRLLMTVYMRLEDIEVVNEWEHLSSRLFLFSATTGEFLWSNSCFPLYDSIAQEDRTHFNTIGSSAVYIHKGARRSDPSCDFALMSGGENNTIMVGQIDSLGIVTSFDIVPSLSSSRPANNNETERFEWKLRQMVYLSSGIVVADVWTEYGRNDLWKSNCTVVSFYPLPCHSLSSNSRCKSSATTAESLLTISNNLYLHNISCVRNDYLIFMCESCLDAPSVWSWFSGTLISVIVHIPSRREVGRFTWNLDIATSYFVPCFASNGQGTLGMESLEIGILMTGDDVRYLDQDDDTDEFGVHDLKMDSQQMEKKKKKKAVRSKKDSFRTHNGDRCY